MSASDIAGITLSLVQPMLDEPGALLPVLHAVQDKLGYIPAESVAVIAGALNLSRAEVHGVISFYHFFRTTPRGDHVLYVCRAESCRAMGALAIEHELKRRLGIDYHETTQDGRFSLEPVYCLGNCACSPSIMLDDDVHSRVSRDSLDELLS